MGFLHQLCLLCFYLALSTATQLTQESIFPVSGLSSGGRELFEFDQEPTWTNEGHRLLQAPSGEYNAAIGVINVTNFTTNRVAFEYILLVTITGGVLSTISSSLMSFNFGRVIPETVSLEFNEEPFDNFVIRGNTEGIFVTASVRAGRGFHILKFSFEAEDFVCRHESGKQALPGGYLGPAAPQGINNRAKFEIDFNFPEGLNPNEYQLEPEPLGEINSETGTIFVQYSLSDLGVNSEDDAPGNVFFILDEELFDSSVVTRSCFVTEVDNTFFLTIIGVPAVACFCLVFLGLVQRYFDRREEQRGVMSPNNRRNNRTYRANRDLILAPQQTETATVTAVPENEDDQALDEMIPINTIQVNVGIDSDDEEGNQRRNSGGNSAGVSL